uniref:isopentenyl-diphosphate Delta-isomerase n=1 Tax=Hirondellea gigas TaxID=1518452 RepID=A0A2P2I9J6_9CRUS
MFAARFTTRSFFSSTVYREMCTASAPIMNNLENISKSQTAALLQERCILVDEKDQVIGSATKLDSHKWDPKEKSCPLHRAFSVFLFNTKGELLLQQRSLDKVTFPGNYTNSCCSHPLYGGQEMDGVQGAVAAAMRRVNYELGVPTDQMKASDFQYLSRILYSGHVPGSPFAEHEVDYIFFLQKDVTLQLNPEEVMSAQYVSRSDITQYLKKLEQEKVPITPWFSLIVKHFLLKWWDNLSCLEQFQDHNTIHKL